MSRHLIHYSAAFLCAASPALLIGLNFAGPVYSGPMQVQLSPTAPLEIRVSNDTVSLLVGIMGIERDLYLGKLFVDEGMTSPEGSHFTHPRQEDFARIKDGLAKAGAPDLEPLLIALEEANGKKAVADAFYDVLGGLKKAESALKPTDQDIRTALLQTVEVAASNLDPSGTTEAVAYQEAWGLLMAASSHLGALSTSSDPAVRKMATKLVMKFDEVVITAPIPNTNAPIAFDPAPVTQLIETLKGDAGSI